MLHWLKIATASPALKLRYPPTRTDLLLQQKASCVRIATALDAGAHCQALAKAEMRLHAVVDETSGRGDDVTNGKICSGLQHGMSAAGCMGCATLQRPAAEWGATAQGRCNFPLWHSVGGIAVTSLSVVRR